MATKPDDILRRPLYVYDLPGVVLEGLTVKADTDSAHIVNEEPAPTPSENLVGSQACALCGMAFSSLQEQRSHLKSDFHNYNLKQRMRNRTPVSETEFEKLIEDLDESLSGSDSEEDDDEEDKDEDDRRQDSTLTALLKKQARLADKRAAGDGGDASDESSLGRRGRGKPPLIWFSSPLLPENHYFGLYRALLTGEDQRHSDLVHVLRRKQVEPVTVPKPAKDGTLAATAYKGPHVFLCMIGGGHFAAMVVSLAPRAAKGNTAMNREATVLAHKTFHRYTTRRKQGGSQSANDNAKGAAHSAGSTLRRYNEQALVDDVRALLRDWKALLDTSELLFVRATGVTNRRTLFGPYEGQVLRHNDSRLRGLPFSTRRATQNELMRSFIELTRLKVREVVPEKETKEAQQPRAPPRSAGSKAPKPKLEEEEETALLHTSQLQAFIRRSKVPALLSYLANHGLSADFEFRPVDQNHHSPRPLHLAASQNSPPLVLGLLTRGGADPCVQNAEGKTPFELAGDRGTRDAFRVARSELGEAKWAWDAANVPAAMTKAEADGRGERERSEADKKEAERRKAEEERLRTEGPKVVEKKAKGNTLGSSLAKTPQERREEETRGLTADMRMKLERERRARAVEERLRRMKSG
ncbi:ankyrin repeat and zinc finger domain containing protein 1 [Metarhizium album ARSEF 1941]|uniref:Ankyrin repeat and zinc finger domain containing protein 1 n=1 Tax=Metarhizium album (strain ARSEF 1941) TaxID=1081103 RepID=A0A0B2X0U9_METAS|nr:ankyrin repeat and zinc finger domain containing protein 1 [Metarhizium album ARSEF 1941]KHN98705.1 ankyrin repeat and zinc finger domain containing protein 1 [Metarhizium album ARSEF 1941]